MIKPPDKMTPKELEGLVRFYESMANYFAEMREPLEAERIRDLATKYLTELHSRDIQS